MECAARDARALAEVGGLFEPPVEGAIKSSSSSSLADISGLGLFAEWADATGFLQRSANLRMIGRSAERWRQTVGGRWRYGRPPSRWVGQSVLDVTLLEKYVAAGRSRWRDFRWSLELWRDREAMPVVPEQSLPGFIARLPMRAKHKTRSDALGGSFAGASLQRSFRGL